MNDLSLSLPLRISLKKKDTLQEVMMDHYHSFKSLEYAIVKPGVMVKIEEEELDHPQSDESPETSAGFAMMNSELIIKTEGDEEESYVRNDDMFEEEENSETSTGHNIKQEIVVKTEEDDGTYVMCHHRFEERYSSPDASPDYVLVKVKEEEEEEEETYGMDFQPFVMKGGHPHTTSGRERDGRTHRMSSKMFIDIDQLIHMVQERPELYDPKVPSYADRYKKRKAWDEICAMVVPHWELCTEKERNSRAKEIQTRWRSLKDCFRRELMLQRKLEKSGITTNRRRKYVHYDGLLFLEPTMKIRDDGGNNFTPASSSSVKDPVEILQPIDVEQAASPSPTPTPPPPPPALPSAPAPTPVAPKRNKKKSTNTSENEWEKHLLSVMDTLKKKTEKTDSDEIFLRSLLPFVRKVPEDRKIDMQLSLMHVVKKFMEPTQPALQTSSSTLKRVNSTHIPLKQSPYEQTSLSRSLIHRYHHPTSLTQEQSCKPTACRSQPPPCQYPQDQEFLSGPPPYSSPSSSSPSINPSPQSPRSSPYYFDL